MAKYKLGGISLNSSTNPEQLAKTVEGILLSCSSLIIYLIGILIDLHINPTNFAELAGLIGTGVGSIFTVWGILRKILVWYTEVKAQ